MASSKNKQIRTREIDYMNGIPGGQRQSSSAALELDAILKYTLTYAIDRNSHSQR